MNQPIDHDNQTDLAAEAMTPQSARGRVIDGAALFSRGLAMGAADIVPGVSGGTIALISGVYERMIEALGSLSLAFLSPLLRGRVRESWRVFWSMQWEVLIPLFGGVMIAVVAMSRVIPYLMDEHPGATFAFFFGLIAAAVWVPFARMKTRSVTHVIVAIIAAAGAWLFVGMQPQGVALEVARHDDGAVTVVYPAKIRNSTDLDAINTVSAENLGAIPQQIVLVDEKGVLNDADLDALDFELVLLADEEALVAWAEANDAPIMVLSERRSSLPWIFLCGVIAISAMILPGVSGAFLLLFLGQYHAVLSSIHGVVDPILAAVFGSDAPSALAAHSWIDDALFLGVFNLGVLIGIVSFSRVVRWLLHHAHDVTMAALTGLMIGALRQPGAEVIAMADGTSNYWLFIGVSALVGGVLVTMLNVFDSRLRSRRLSAS